ncbi:hypothetical protein QVD17_10058 [Tagetes erecta]|uniref:Uncharacterized protein n=1 Tax=Tagetes erecta TaxID=13708 RepID=A0AAD8L755_TARER|nr:hypothetical protein QVD17_10058 [Tagetes erecta]
MEEAKDWASGNYLRTFFVMLLLSNSISRPGVFWTATKNILMEDILHHQRQITNIPNLELDQKELEKICLSHIENLLQTNGSSLKYFDDMPNVEENYLSSLNNRLLLKELSYDRTVVVELVENGDGGRGLCDGCEKTVKVQKNKKKKMKK